ncbi:MAG: tetratricopeptide repeat protein [Acidobacteria bacterium]|nr:tetratricopeptide repeat protein [Acidobacteriota bacterium]
MRYLLALVLLASCGTKPPPVAEDRTDARLCAACHTKEAAAFRNTGMGRSFYRPTPETVPAGSFTHSLSGRTFTIQPRDGKFYFRREPGGLDLEIHYVLGSGSHARTLLHKNTRNRLIELPVTWYPPGKYAMSPGYDRPDHFDARRAVGFECMFCHNGYPEVKNAAMTEDPAFPGRIPEGIECQRCHGNAAAHVRAAQNNAAPGDVRAGVVNPRKLPADRQMEVCMQCHLETTSFPLPNMLVRFERGAFSYDAAEPLANYALHFDHENGHAGKFEIAGSAYRLRQSKCFTASAGRLTCLNCHNPHKASTDYDAACLQCHTKAHKKPDCASCHMETRRTEDVVHAAVVDHKIQRPSNRKDLLAPRAERHEVMGVTSYRGPVKPYYPAQAPELYTAIAQVAHQSNLAAGLPRLQAALKAESPKHPEYYLHMAFALQNAGRPVDAVSYYESALRIDGAYQPALRAYGAALAKSGQTGKAMELLQRAVSLDPNDAASWLAIAEVLTKLGRSAEAANAARRAVEAEPENAEAHNTLGLLTQDAQALRDAIRRKPELASAHFNLALLLANRKEFREATEHALQAAASSPEAADLLGNLQAAQGNWRGAAQVYRDMLARWPGQPKALIGLGTALAGLRDVAGARAYLAQAAQSADPAVRQEAASLLQELP